MRLTQILRVFFPKKKKIPGLVNAGKVQREKPVKTSQKMTAVNKLMREEQNLIYINNPYLMTAEETVYGIDHSAARREERKIAFFESKRSPFYPDKTLEEHFRDTVYTQKKWE